MSADVIAELRADYLAAAHARRLAARRSDDAQVREAIRAELAAHGLGPDAPLRDWPDGLLERAIACARLA